MGTKGRIATAAGMLFLCGAVAQAQDAGSELSIDGTAPQAGAGCVAVAGTPVDIEMLDPIGSATSTRGMSFRIALAAPLVVDGIELLPAGAAGQGEVVHADRSRGGGKPGELLLAARYLEHDAGRIPLRGMKMGGHGEDRIQAALATSFAIGPFAHFIRGREIEIPAGTRAHARLSADATLPCAPTATQAVPAAKDAPPANGDAAQAPSGDANAPAITTTTTTTTEE